MRGNCRCHWYEAELYGGKPDAFKVFNTVPVEEGKKSDTSE